MHAPMVAAMIAVSHHGPIAGSSKKAHSQPPMTAPITPTTMSPMRPKLPPFMILPARKPAIRPMIKMKRDLALQT